MKGRQIAMAVDSVGCHLGLMGSRGTGKWMMRFVVGLDPRDGLQLGGTCAREDSFI